MYSLIPVLVVLLGTNRIISQAEFKADKRGMWKRNERNASSV
jgi:hypothetical protein